MRWWTSDHHFGHRNIIGYCDRPFADVDAMHRALVERWNDLVADGDEVWILGDLVMGDLVNSRLLVLLSAYVSRLRGTKVLVPGNHDLCWARRRDGPQHANLYYDVGGIARIIDDPSPIILADRTVRLNHFPYLAHPPGRPPKHAQWQPKDTGDWLLCGHVHNAWRQKGRQINVGVDAWHYNPVDDDTLAALVAAGASNIACPTYTTPLESIGGR